MNHQQILTKDMPADLSGLKLDPAIPPGLRAAYIQIRPAASPSFMSAASLFLWNLPTVRRPSLMFLQNSCTAGAAACKGGIP